MRVRGQSWSSTVRETAGIAADAAAAARASEIRIAELSAQVRELRHVVLAQRSAPSAHPPAAAPAPEPTARQPVDPSAEQPAKPAIDPDAEQRAKPANPSKRTGKRRTETLAARFSRLPVDGLRCPICARDQVRWASAYPGIGARFRMAVVLYCAHCGSGHVPDADTLLDDYYRDEYARTNRKDRDSDAAEYFATGPGVKLSFRRARTQVEMLEQSGAAFDTVLDYGSGPGYFLHEAQPRESFAVELDEHSYHYLDHLGATRLEPSELGTDRFDVIVASHVIEHFTATTLDDVVGGLAAALKVGGRILIEVPQGGHSYLTITHNQEPHTLFFTPNGLLDTIRRAGLEVLEAKARVRKPFPRRGDPVFVAPDDLDFEGVDGSGLTVIATRRG